MAQPFLLRKAPVPIQSASLISVRREVRAVIPFVISRGCVANPRLSVPLLQNEFHDVWPLVPRPFFSVDVLIYVGAIAFPHDAISSAKSCSPVKNSWLECLYGCLFESPSLPPTSLVDSLLADSSYVVQSPISVRELLQMIRVLVGKLYLCDSPFVAQIQRSGFSASLDAVLEGRPIANVISALFFWIPDADASTEVVVSDALVMWKRDWAQSYRFRNLTVTGSDKQLGATGGHPYCLAPNLARLFKQDQISQVAQVLLSYHVRLLGFWKLEQELKGTRLRAVGMFEGASDPLSLCENGELMTLFPAVHHRIQFGYADESFGFATGNLINYVHECLVGEPVVRSFEHKADQQRAFQKRKLSLGGQMLGPFSTSTNFVETLDCIEQDATTIDEMIHGVPARLSGIENALLLSISRVPPASVPIGTVVPSSESSAPEYWETWKQNGPVGMDVEEMARLGFYLLRGGTGPLVDVIQCVGCGLTLFFLIKGMDLNSIHLVCKPHCPFVERRVPVSAKSLDQSKSSFFMGMKSVVASSVTPEGQSGDHRLLRPLAPKMAIPRRSPVVVPKLAPIAQERVSLTTDVYAATELAGESPKTSEAAIFQSLGKADAGPTLMCCMEHPAALRAGRRATDTGGSDVPARSSEQSMELSLFGVGESVNPVTGKDLPFIHVKSCLYGGDVVHVMKAKADKRLVVVKTVDYDSQPQAKAALKRVKSFKGLSHPGLLYLRDAFATKKKLTLVADVKEGSGIAPRSVGTLLVIGGLSHVQEQLSLFIRITAAVRCLTSRRLWHGAISTSNILCDGKMAILGFPHVDANRATSVISLFSPPEGVSYPRAKPTGCSADVWSLGVVFVAIASGDPTVSFIPKYPVNPQGFLFVHEHIRARLESNVLFSGGFCEMCCEMLSRDPMQRPSLETITLMLRNLRKKLGMIPAEVHPKEPESSDVSGTSLLALCAASSTDSRPDEDSEFDECRFKNEELDSGALAWVTKMTGHDNSDDELPEEYRYILSDEAMDDGMGSDATVRDGGCERCLETQADVYLSGARPKKTLKRGFVDSLVACVKRSSVREFVFAESQKVSALDDSAVAGKGGMVPTAVFRKWLSELPCMSEYRSYLWPEGAQTSETTESARGEADASPRSTDGVMTRSVPRRVEESEENPRFPSPEVQKFLVDVLLDSAQVAPEAWLTVMQGRSRQNRGADQKQYAAKRVNLEVETGLRNARALRLNIPRPTGDSKVPMVVGESIWLDGTPECMEQCREADIDPDRMAVSWRQLNEVVAMFKTEFQSRFETIWAMRNAKSR